MQTPSRRDFNKQALGSLVTFSLLETLFRNDLFADEVKPLTTRWLVDEGALSLRFKFPEVEGLPKSQVFGKQIFALKRDRSVVPHGHDNMATAFLVLKGDLQGRHYDRVADEPEHFLIKPTIDRSFKPGECSTVSDYKDNIHWFKALTEPAYIFNLHLLDVKPGSQKPTGRLYLDPNGEKIEGGLVRARRLEYEEANKLYG